VNDNSVQGVPTRVSSFKNFFYNINYRIGIPIDLWIACFILSRNDNGSGTSRPSTIAAARLILPEASFHFKKMQSNESDTKSKFSNGIIQSQITILTLHGPSFAKRSLFIL